MQKERLEDKLQKVAKTKLIAWLLKACNSIYFIVFYAIFTLLSSIFGLELYFYLFTGLVVLFVCLFAEDTKILLVPVFFIIFCVAFQHSNDTKQDVKYFQSLPFLLAALFAGILALPAVIIRLFFYRQKGNILKDKVPFKLGLLFMSVAILLNGIFAREYTFKNLLYAFEMLAALVAVFVFFYQTLHWKKEYTDYIFYIFILLAGVLLVQFIVTLFFKDNLGQWIGVPMKPGFVAGSIEKYDTYFGWGVANVFAGIMTMLLPAFYYFAYTKKHGYLYYIASFVVFFAILLSQGRASILIAALFVFAAILFFSIKKTQYRLFYWIFNASLLLIGVFVLIFAFDKIQKLLKEIFERGTDISGRWDLWIGGIKNFWQYPIFGSGFYAPLDITNASIGYDKLTSGLTPYFYHNIVIEVMARFGIVGIVAFVYHFYELIWQYIKNRNTQNTAFLCVLLMILLCSLGDTFFFNLHSTLYYAIILLAWSKNIQLQKQTNQQNSAAASEAIAA